MAYLCSMNTDNKDLEGLILSVKQIDISNSVRYMTAGNSVCTFVNTLTGGRFTYRIECANMKYRNLYFVSALTGNDNTKDYEYFGIIKRINNNFYFEFAPDITKTRLTPSAASVVAFYKIWEICNTLRFLRIKDNNNVITDDFNLAFKFINESEAAQYAHKFNIIDHTITNHSVKKINGITTQYFDYSIIQKRITHQHLQIWRSSHCARCGKKITVPKSVESGFGPICINQYTKGH